MKIRPNLAYRNPCIPLNQMDPAKVYDAVPACNQPNWQADGLIFAHGHLLKAGEYTIVEADRMEYTEARHLAIHAFRHFYYGNRDEDNLFAHDNLYRMHWYDTHREADKLHYDVGVFLFEREFENRLATHTALVSYLREWSPHG